MGRVDIIFLTSIDSSTGFSPAPCTSQRGAYRVALFGFAIRTLARIFSAALIFGLAYSSARASTSATSSPLEIDVVLSLTGPGAAIGRDESQAFAVIEKHTNAAGGINDQPIHFNIHDDQTSPQVAVQLANMIIQKKPAFFFGSSMSGSCYASAALAITGPVQFCLSPAFIPKSGSYAYGSGVSTVYDNYPVLKYLRSKKLLRLAILAVTDASGQAGERGIDESLNTPRGKDFTVVTREHFNPTDVTINAQAARIASSGAQAIILESSGTPTGTALRGLNDVGLHLTVVSNSSIMDYDQLKQYAAFLPANLLVPSFLYIERAKAGPLRAPQAAFYGDLQAEGYRPTILHSLSWDPFMILISALQKYGNSASASQIKRYVDSLHGFGGVNGVYDFSRGDGHGLTDAALVMVRWNARTNDWDVVSRRGGDALR
jgi:branched-chain amino acid transport system substrate-binding protein